MPHKNFYVILGFDILFLTLSFYLSYFIRFDFSMTFTIPLGKHLILLVLLIKILCFYYFDLYKGMWRYTSIPDLINILKASTLSTLILMSLLLISNRFLGFSRSIFIIDWVLTILFISGLRISVRFYFENMAEGSLRSVLLNFFRKFAVGAKKDDRKKLLIIGAGDCGEKIFREIRNNAQLRYNVVGFLDDHPVKVGKKIHGIPVLNSITNLKNTAEKVKADEILIAIPSATSAEMRTIVEYCKETGLPYRTVPNYGELIDGKVTVNSIRKVAYRDLLRRDVVRLDNEKIGAYLTDKSILVTGAGGSIGSELCRQICRYKPSVLVLYEWAETPLFEIELELRKNFPELKIVPLLADIQNIKQLEHAFKTYKPRVVFHSAAYKHVPMLELQPWKAVENNILGTFNVVECAKRYDVERFVFVSTDKAVRPANVMGVTKRIAEILVQNQNSSEEAITRFMIVRFGNVVGSSGSVVPLFKKQIQQGGPVTVTHKDVSRYFMTIPEASQLILQAGAIGNGAEIYILDMGTPVKIDAMARDLIRLSGFKPDEDIKIDYIGLRPGEKLFEELITGDEGIVQTRYNKIMALKGKGRNLVYLNGSIDRLAQFASDQDSEQIRKSLKEIVPEYNPLN